jgi:rubredoxin
MELEQLITVATFNDWEKADALRHRLDGAGMPAQVYDESTTQRLWWFVKPKAHMRVRVEKKNAERAEAAMRAWDKSDHVLDGAIICPECGSSTIEYPQFSRKTLMTFFFAFLTLLRIMPKQFYCRDCQFTWAAEPPKPKPDLDILNWSVKKPVKKTL